MVIAHDAISYEYSGKLLFEKGWLKYFTTGPNREPLYPFLISLSMRLASLLSVSYQTIQILSQIFFLFLTQTLALFILRKLEIKEGLCALIILYLGISPSIVNSALCLYSEIITYPLILSIIILSTESLETLRQNNLRKSILMSLALSFNFTLITLTKGIFEAITPCFLLAFLYLASKELKAKNAFKNCLIFFAIFFCFYYGAITSYKGLNKKFNGRFTLTDRASWALYGNTARRMEPLTNKRLLSALAYVPSWRLCHHLFGEKECYFWSQEPSDNLGAKKRNELSTKVSLTEVDQTLITLSLKEALKNPVQYFALYLLEGAKMLFWEAPNMQYLVYPPVITKIYSLKPLNLSLYIIPALLTLFSLLFSLQSIKRNTLILLIFSLIVPYISLHSLFFIIPRFAYPLIPLYLILISFVINGAFKKSAA